MQGTGHVPLSCNFGIGFVGAVITSGITAIIMVLTIVVNDGIAFGNFLASRALILSTMDENLLMPLAGFEWRGVCMY